MFNVSLDAYRKYLFKRYGWPLKGPLGFVSPEKGCLLWARVPAEQASPLAITANLHEDHALTASRSPPALATNNSWVSDWLCTHWTGKPNVVSHDFPTRNHHPMRSRWSSSYRWLTRSRGRSCPLSCFPVLPCFPLNPHGSWRIWGRLSRLLWRSLGHHLVLRTCCCWGWWRRRRSRWHPGLSIPPGEGGQLRGGHLHPSVVDLLLGIHDDSVSHPGDDGKRVVQLFCHDPWYHWVPDNWMTNPQERWYICTRART
jgi:hypothetical protein